MPRKVSDLTSYADKPATPLQEAFADWIEEETGKTFGTQKERAAFREGVRLAKVLIMRFQKSEASKEASEAAKEAKAAARAESEEEETAKPVKKAARKAKAKAEEAPKAPATRGRRKGKKASTDEESVDAPF